VFSTSFTGGRDYGRDMHHRIGGCSAPDKSGFRHPAANRPLRSSSMAWTTVTRTTVRSIRTRSDSVPHVHTGGGSRASARGSRHVIDLVIKGRSTIRKGVADTRAFWRGRR
jgi:hypothetical protein